MRRSAVVSDAIEFEPGELLRELLRRSWVIVLCTIIAAMAVLLVSMFFVDPYMNRAQRCTYSAANRETPA